MFPASRWKKYGSFANGSSLLTEEKRLRLMIAHLDDAQTFPLTYEQLATYGFDV
jgi:hypothetical protein